MEFRKKEFGITAIVFICILVLPEFGCNQRHVEVNKEPLVKSYKKDRFIIVEERDSLGHLLSSKSYNKDGERAEGPQIDYYMNGHIKKWLWFGLKSQQPYFGAYYNSNGNFDSFKGYPMIEYARTPTHELVVETVNPPNVAYILGFREFSKEKVLSQAAYAPAISDTTSWFTLSDIRFSSGHDYYVYFYFVDTSSGRNKIIDSSFRKLHSDLGNGDW